MKEEIVEIITKSNIRTFTAEVVGDSPLSFSKHYDYITVPKLNDKESPDSYEQRTWANRLHWDKEGQVYVPPTMVKNSIVTTASFLALKIPGRGNATFSKHFEHGILVTEPVMLGVHRDEVGYETYFVPSDGKPGGGKRVKKNFPVLYDWRGTAKIFVLDDEIPNAVFGRVLAEAGRFNGWGRFRTAEGRLLRPVPCREINC